MDDSLMFAAKQIDVYLLQVQDADEILCDIWFRHLRKSYLLGRASLPK
jgi:hypothetical protein